MKKGLQIIFVLVLLMSRCIVNLHAQWRQAPSHPSSSNKIMYYNNLVGYQVGNNGLLLKTSDGGQTWKALASRVSNNLYSLHFPTATVGYVGGANIFLKTIDGGRTWMYYLVPATGIINDVFFLSEQVGWACTDAGEIISTVDGGLNWNKYNSSGSNFKGIYFISATHGWVVGSNGVVLRTTNGGQSWVNASIGIPTTEDAQAVEFTDANNGWIATANGIIYRTNNGGSTWQSSTIPGPLNLYDISFVSPNVGYAATNQGVKKSSDGGATWASTSFISTVYSIDFYSEINGTASYSGGQNFTTQDGGASWVTKEVSNGLNTYGISFASASSSTGWKVGQEGFIAKTSNGGSSWVDQSNSGMIYTLLSVYAHDASNAWAVGVDGIIMFTSNGNAWSDQVSGTTNNLFDVNFTSSTDGIIVGDAGTILKTTNGGASWSSIASGTTSTLRGVHFPSATLGIAVGFGGTILRTTNSGTSWSAISSGTTSNILAVYFPTTLIGYAVTATGGIFKSTDGGSTWTAQTSNTTNALLSVHFVDASNGWATGVNGTILLTKNGGTTWTDLEFGVTNQPLNSVHFYSPQNGYIVGNSGTNFQFEIDCSIPSTPVNYTSSASAAVCAGDAASIRAASIGTLTWWDAPTGGTYLGDGFTLGGGSNYFIFSSSLTSSRTVYAEDLTCVNNQRTALAVTVNSTYPSNATTQTGDTLSAVEAASGIVYQWIYCSTNFSIPTQSGQTFTPIENGSYAVILNLGGCYDTSTCIPITGITPVTNTIPSETVSVFPNPVADELTLDIGALEFSGSAQVKLMDVSGKILLVQKITQNGLKNIAVNELPSGLYVLEVEADGRFFRQAIVKK